MYLHCLTLDIFSSPQLIMTQNKNVTVSWYCIDNILYILDDNFLWWVGQWKTLYNLLSLFLKAYKEEKFTS